MNPIQKAWLIALRPVISLVNDKLAKKTGILGRIGKFYSFGPRQFGFHPINRGIALLNKNLVDFMAFALHQYPILRSFTRNGFYTSRPNAIIAMLGPLMILHFFVYMLSPSQGWMDDGTTMSHLKNKDVNAPYNGLNARTSAHFTQINEMYFHEMSKRYFARREELVNKRSGLNEQTKKTRFAIDGYKYIQAHSKSQ